MNDEKGRPEVESLSKLGGDQFPHINTFQLGPVSACDVMCKFIVKIMTRNYLLRDHPFKTSANFYYF